MNIEHIPYLATALAISIVANVITAWAIFTVRKAYSDYVEETVGKLEVIYDQLERMTVERNKDHDDSVSNLTCLIKVLQEARAQGVVFHTDFFKEFSLYDYLQEVVNNPETEEEETL